MKKIILILILVPFITIGQIGSRKNPYKAPKEFFKNLKYNKANNIYNGINTIEQEYNQYSSNDFTDKEFVVYSDRNENFLYDDIDGTKTKTKLQIGEKVYVTQLASNWIEVAEKKNKNFIVIGWINAKNILINNLPLLADELNIIKRGIILVDPGKMSELTKEQRKEAFKKIQVASYFSSPNLSNPIGKDAKEFEIRYIYKSVINDQGVPTFLLGRGTTFSGKGQRSSLQGWIADAKLTQWNSRLCLEPISQELNQRAYDDYTEYKSCGKTDTNYVFWDGQYIGTYNRKEYEGCEQQDYIDELKSGNFGISHKEAIIESRWSGSKMRYPVLSVGQNSETIENREIAVVTRLASNNDDINRDELVVELRDLTKKTKKINILFVLDATSSMKKYHKSISNAIDNIIENLSEDENIEEIDAKNVQFALAIYRNKKDENNNQYPRFEYIPLSNNKKDITSKIRNERIYGSSEKVSSFEDHYYGMIQGIDKTFGIDTDGESNIIVLIGDCGAIETSSYSREKVINKLIENKLSLISYQCNFNTKLEGNQNPYLSLNKDIALYTRALGKNYFGSEENGGYAIDVSGNEARLRSKINRNDWIAPIFAAYKNANRSNPSISVTELERHVTNTITNYISTMETRAQELGESINYDFDSDIATTKKKEEIKALWRSYGYSEEEIQALLNIDFFTVRGNTPMSHGQNNSNGWQEIILMEADFKSGVLDEQLSNLINVSSSSSQQVRQKFFEGLCALMQGFIEGKNDDNEVRVTEIKELRMQEVWEKLFGIKMKGWESIENKKIEQILDSSSVSDEQFEDFYYSFKNEVEDFLEGSAEFSKCVWEYDKTKFYWLPLNKIPGCSKY